MGSSMASKMLATNSASQATLRRGFAAITV
jgi:hypothetical protein